MIVQTIAVMPANVVCSGCGYCPVFDVFDRLSVPWSAVFQCRTSTCQLKGIKFALPLQTMECKAVMPLGERE